MNSFDFLNKKKILLAEDDYFNQELMTDVFEEVDCTLQIVGNGTDAVNKFLTENYDVVLMDVNMPDMNGYDAAREIREIEKKRKGDRTPILAITANALQGDRERCLQSGMDDYISKPIHINDLLDKMRLLLEQ